MARNPRIPLGAYPTPVALLGSLSQPGTELWVKRDDLTAALYGGNKVRKLEYLLGAARARGCTRIVTLGAVGSHHVLATATYGRLHGFTVEAALVAQPGTPHAANNGRAGLAQGLVAWPSPPSLVPYHVARRCLGAGGCYVPVGGSNTLGALGYADAARELAAQVRAGALPLPELVVVTLGSGGTVAGLAAGFAAEGLPTRVLGVTVAEPPWFVQRMARRLARSCARELGASPDDASARIETTTRWLGRGYGHATPEGEAATLRAREVGLALDPTYTAKTFAAALARVEEGREKVVLYWHTLSSAPLGPLLEGAPESLPSALETLLRPPEGA
jgi:D-cysteine desulfhydrase